MKKIQILFLLLFGVLFRSSAQQTGIIYNRGLVYTPDQYTEIEGTPYIRDNWFSGEAITKDSGTHYKLAKVNFDVVKNKFVYYRGDQIYELPQDITEIILGNEKGQDVFKNGFNNIPNAGQDRFFEVLAEGKVSLLKDFRKKIVDEYQYNNANKTQRFKQMEYYYCLPADGSAKQITLSEKEMKDLLSDKWDKVQQYMQQNKLSAKKESDWKKIIGYYNSL